MGGRNQDAAINGRGDGQTDLELETVSWLDTLQMITDELLTNNILNVLFSKKKYIGAFKDH